MTPRLPPTSPELLNDASRPYFVWWADVTIGNLRQRLGSSDVEQRAYRLGALLRGANTRDVWLFTTPEEVRAAWPHLIRYLGTARQRWAWLLDIPEPVWPPREVDRA